MSSVHLISGRLNMSLVWEAAQQELIQVLGKPDLKKVAAWAGSCPVRPNDLGSRLHQAIKLLCNNLSVARH